MKKLIVSLALAAAASVFVCAPSHAQHASEHMEMPAQQSSIGAYAYSFDGIDGGAINLSDYRGKVLVIVNVASQCGYTPQYAGLEELYEKYKDRGLVVIGVPANDFGGQEPGSNADIKKFGQDEFNVTFPMAAKTSVIGRNAHPFYQWAAQTGKGDVRTTIPRWNFHKYIIAPDGSLARSFDSSVTPMSGELTTTVEALLEDATP